MAETVQTGQPRTPQLVRAASLVNAAQIAHDTEVRQSPNGVSFATFGETGLADLDLDRMLETVPTAITAALKANTYYFVPAWRFGEAAWRRAPKILRRTLRRTQRRF